MTCHGETSLCLEPDWTTVRSEDIVDIQGDIIVHDKSGCKHLFRSVIHKQLFTVSGALANHPAFSFLQCKLMVNEGRFHLDCSQGYALGLPIPTTTMYNGAMEVCAGIAMMSQGLTSCGLDLKATNDLQETNCAYQGKVRVM